MEAEVIAIGDELTSGQRLDTNSRWLSQQLGWLGFDTVRHTTVGDRLADNIEVFRNATARVQVIVCTGGLGPTQDDLTRQALADAFDAPLELDRSVLETIRNLFAARGRRMPQRNELQAMFPRGSLVIPNPHGSAPGIDLTVNVIGNSCRIFALPGVPAEMFEMWSASVAPRLNAMRGDPRGPLRHRVLKLFGIGESEVEARLPELIDRQRVPTVGITVSRATITLRITGRGRDQEQFEAMIAPTLAEIKAELGDLIFGGGDDELEHAVMRQLERRCCSLACVEIGAASWITDWMLQAAGEHSSCFRGGVALPNIEAARGWLDDPASQLDSEPLWAALAELARQRFNSEVGLAVGFYPAQNQLLASRQAIEFFFAIADEQATKVVRRSMGGHPDVLGPRVAKTGLDLTRRWLSRAADEDLPSAAGH